MKSRLLALFTLLIALQTRSQEIRVNPDGTHTVIHNSDGPVSVQVNPDGTHTVEHRQSKDLSILVNPDGTHTIIIHRKKKRC